MRAHMQGWRGEREREREGELGEEEERECRTERNRDHLLLFNRLVLHYINKYLSTAARMRASCEARCATRRISITVDADTRRATKVCFLPVQ